MQPRTMIVTVLVLAAVLSFGSCGNSNAASNSASHVDGQGVYTRFCIACHGLDGKQKTNGAKDITLSQLKLKERIALIKSGRNQMTPFDGVLAPAQIEAVAQYSMSLK